MNRIYFTLIILIIINCKNQNSELNNELIIYDNSLDSLIKEKVFTNNTNLIFQGDTLNNNPKSIEELCYGFIGNDSTKIDSNSHIFKFKRNRLTTKTTEIYGKKYVHKYIYFDDIINNDSINLLIHKNQDTNYVAYIQKYNSKGDLIKFVESSLYENKTNRVVKVYKSIDNHSQKVWMRDYFKKEYNIDSLRKIKVKHFISKNHIWNQGLKFNYEYDEFGNWIMKKNIGNTKEVYYRKIEY